MTTAIVLQLLGASVGGYIGWTHDTRKNGWFALILKLVAVSCAGYLFEHILRAGGLL